MSSLHASCRVGGKGSGGHRKKNDDGLRVAHDYGALHNDVREVELLAKEVPQAATAANNLAVYEGVKLADEVHLVRMTKMTHGNLGVCLG